MGTASRLDYFKVELAIGTAGAWVDVTDDVELGLAPLTFSYGATDRFNPAPGPSLVRFDLVNNDETAPGKYTPDNPTSAYFGRLVEGVAARWSIGAYDGPTASRLRYRHWFGEIQRLNPIFPDDDAAHARVQVVLVDILARLGRTPLQDLLTEQTLLDGVYGLWLGGDPQGSIAVAEQSPADAAPLSIGGVAAQVGFGGGNGLPYDGLPTISLNQQADLGPGWLYVNPAPASGAVFECWLSYPAEGRPGMPGIGTAPPTLLEARVSGGNCAQFGVVLDSLGRLTIRADSNIGASPSGVVADGRLHHVAIFGNRDGGGTPAAMYVDGVLTGTANARWYGFTDLSIGSANLTDWQLANGIVATSWKGTVSRMAVAGASVAAQTAIPARYALGTVMQEAATARINRLLSYLRGVAITAVHDGYASGAVVGPQETQGKSLLASVQEAWAGEGSRMWTTRTQYDAAAPTPMTGPQITFAGRASGRPSAVKLTLAVEADLIGAPQMTRGSDGQVAVATAQSRVLAVTTQDDALAGAIGPVSATVDSALVDAAELLFMAQDRIAQARTVRVRINGLAVDPFLATVTPSGGGPNWSLWGALLSLQQGDRVRVTGLPSSKLGFSQLDGYVLGVTETHTAEGVVHQLTLAPADEPAEAEASHATYGRASGGTGWLTLGGAITSTATAASLAFAAAPGLSVDAADYPLDLDLNGEIVTVAAAPAGATSPQAVTISRGQRGTVARAHAAGEPADMLMAPAAGW